MFPSIVDVSSQMFVRLANLLLCRGYNEHVVEIFNVHAVYSIR